MIDHSPSLVPTRPLRAGAVTRIAALLPGVALCAAVTVAALAAEALEVRVLGRAWVEALVLAILIGAAVRTAHAPGPRFQAGIAFSAKTLLEVAVMLLGAALSFGTLAGIGPALLFGIAGVVAVAIPASFILCRLLGLPARMAVLVACGTSICGNSAIAAVAPVIGAEGEDVAASIAFTAILGVGAVLGLPLLAASLGMSPGRAGVLSGLTVYAVPQVIAATAPMGLAAVQVGTLVKLVRVLMLGPVILALAPLARRLGHENRSPAAAAAGGRPAGRRIPIGGVVPWFIVGFLALATLHSLGALPAGLLAPVAGIANGLTILSMAALGLGVDGRVLGRTGSRVVAAATASLLVLGAVSLGLIGAVGPI